MMILGENGIDIHLYGNITQSKRAQRCWNMHAQYKTVNESSEFGNQHLYYEVIYVIMGVFRWQLKHSNGSLTKQPIE